MTTIDTRFNRCIDHLFQYIIEIPEHIHDIKSITIVSIEMPISFHNISSVIGNNCFCINRITKNKKELNYGNNITKALDTITK